MGIDEHSEEKLIYLSMQEGIPTIEELKEQLRLELLKPASDTNLILQLSNDIANRDENAVRFSVDAGIINRLGKELVGRHETAVSELIKNAYDADATIVHLRFEGCDVPGGTLTIMDNGIGMSKEQLLNGYMRLSSSDKAHNPKSPNFDRQRAGQKGIGRFAAQRIGKKLKIVTQTKEASKALQIDIDWDRYTMDSNLLLITNDIQEIDKQQEQGTTLYISDVRDKWSIDAIERTYKYITELLQPFPLSRRFHQSNNDPGFKVEFLKDGLVIVDETSSFFQHAIANIEGYVDDEGQGYYGFSSEKLSIAEDVYLIGKKEREDKYEVLRNVHLKAYYFIYNVGLIPRKVETYIRQNAEEYGGIRLYRNGFRVLPYAEKDDDWLRLDASARRRTIIAPHGANSFYGFIEVIDPDGTLFQEQSSREGLIENQAMQELRDFTYKVLTDCAIKISYVRKRKGTAGEKTWNKKTTKEAVDEAKETLSGVIAQAGADVSTDTHDHEPLTSEEVDLMTALKELEEKLELVDQVSAEEKQANEQEKQELLKEIQMLRILAGLGLTIGEFVHEVNHYEPAFKYDAELLTSLVETPQGKEAGLRLQNNLTAFTVYTAYFNEAISKNVNRQLKPIELRDAVLFFEKSIGPDLVRSGIELDTKGFHGYNLFTRPMHISEWASILFNLYTNSKKAIKKVAANGKIAIAGGKVGKKVFLEFSDNGIGIPEESKDEIFEAFYTTSSPVGSQATNIEELTGTGLGLKIVHDIVEGYGGNISVVSPKEGYVTTIRIEIPKSAS